MLTGSLLSLLQNKTIVIDADHMIGITLDIAGGMDFLHSENLLHCDLAARNLLVNSL